MHAALLLRRNRLGVAALALVVSLVALGACSSDDDSATTTSVTLPADLPVTLPADEFATAVPRCDDLPDPADSLDWSGVQAAEPSDPIATLGALQVAMAFPYVVDVWGGTGLREGWIVVGVVGGAVELQAEIDAGFPGAKVLAMPLDWTRTELIGLANAVDDATLELGLDVPATISMARGVVRVHLDTITEERVATLSEFVDDRVCIEGEFA